MLERLIYQSIGGLWRSLQRDPRHCNVELILRRPADERRFPEWTMAFSTYQSLYVHGMKGFFQLRTKRIHRWWPCVRRKKIRVINNGVWKYTRLLDMPALRS
jgi:hypothetical protein